MANFQRKTFFSSWFQCRIVDFPKEMQKFGGVEAFSRFASLGYTPPFQKLPPALILPLGFVLLGAECDNSNCCHGKSTEQLQQPRAWNNTWECLTYSCLEGL